MSEMLEKPSVPPGECSWWLPSRHESAGVARRVLRTFLAGHPGGERFTETGELVLGELVANSVLHAQTPPGRLVLVHLDLRPDSLRVEVHDADGTPPSAPHATAGFEESGRGLLLVSLLAADWGCRPRARGVGKAMWAVIGTDGDAK
ncbi:ATP-binding protein [Kitasatospora brasiliensis]|uniref:ATP-binding protein n=1 Tax=Kitasatospora brasiliensis TaxID=3058040 RepID=UPI0029310E2C|nr:ATP-binding protein [Kitasatospora sp. K002]